MTGLLEVQFSRTKIRVETEDRLANWCKYDIFGFRETQREMQRLEEISENFQRNWKVFPHFHVICVILYIFPQAVHDILG